MLPIVAFARFTIQLGLALQPPVSPHVPQRDAATRQHATHQ
jgi:hypothetical protein